MVKFNRAGTLLDAAQKKHGIDWLLKKIRCAKFDRPLDCSPGLRGKQNEDGQARMSSAKLPQHVKPSRGRRAHVDDDEIWARCFRLFQEVFGVSERLHVELVSIQNTCQPTSGCYVL